jgi:hypothetical protein
MCRISVDGRRVSSSCRGASVEDLRDSGSGGASDAAGSAVLVTGVQSVAVPGSGADVSMLRPSTRGGGLDAGRVKIER